MTKRVVVTGGAGFIGANLCHHLVAREYDVVAIDDLWLGDAGYLHGVVPLLEFDIRDTTALVGALEGADAVVHLAAASSAPMFSSDLVDASSRNIMGFYSVLHAARATRTPRMLFASTSSIYGRLAMPHHEGLVPQPVNHYAATKIANEQLATIASDDSFETLGLRFFSVFGNFEEHKRQYANLVSQFLWAMSEGRSPEVWGDGNQTRDFIWVGDVVTVIERLLALPHRYRVPCLNVGTGTSTTLRALVEVLNTVLGTSIAPCFPRPSLPTEYIHDQQCDGSKLREMIDFHPTALTAAIETVCSLQAGANHKVVWDSAP